MVVHPPINRGDIELFFQELAENFSGAARLYLVGGATLTFEEIIPETLDLELVIDCAPEVLPALYGIIRGICTELEIHVNDLPPEARLPLPAGSADRHIPVQRFGGIDLYHFDLYSVTLSRLARGREQDYHDTLALLKAERIEWLKLQQYFHEILPQVGRTSLNQDPLEFNMNFEALKAKWRSAGGNP